MEDLPTILISLVFTILFIYALTHGQIYDYDYSQKCLFLLPSVAIILFMTSCNHVVNKDSYQYIDSTSAHTLMWKVENAEKKEIAYVFGTMHLQHKSFLENIEGWDSVFNSCDAVCIEGFFGAKMTSSDNSQMMGIDA